MKKKNRNKHPRRQRKQFRGELIQIDATPYEWFGGDKKYALHASIDDAGNTITGAYFTHNECLLGYLEIMRQTTETAERYKQYQEEHPDSVRPKCLQGIQCHSKCNWRGEKALKREV